MVFHWSLSDSKSPQVSRTHLRILAVLSNAVVWIVSTHPPTSKSFRPFNNPLVIVPNAAITIGTIVTFMFHGFFNSLARSRYLSFFSLSFRFILWSTGIAKSTILQILFFLIHWKFYTATLADGFPPEFEWHQVFSKSSGLFSMFWSIFILLLSGWSPLVLYFQIFQPRYQYFEDCFERNNYNWYHYHPHVLFFLFSIAGKVEVLISYFYFYFVVSLSFFVFWGFFWLFFFHIFFFLIFWLSLGLVEISWSVCISKSQRTLHISLSRTDFGLRIYQLFLRSNVNFLHNSRWILSPPSRVWSYTLFAMIYCIYSLWFVYTSVSRCSFAGV